jgi:hypothetical protein
VLGGIVGCGAEGDTELVDRLGAIQKRFDQAEPRWLAEGTHRGEAVEGVG